MNDLLVLIAIIGFFAIAFGGLIYSLGRRDDILNGRK